MATYGEYNIDNGIRNPQLREIMEKIMDISAGHDHDGVNSKTITVGVPDDGSVSLAKLDATLQASIGSADTALQPGEFDVATGTPVNAVAATGTLTINGVVIDGETITIGTDIYEIAADAAQTVVAGHIPVDITAVSTASQGTLTVATQPTSGDTMTIGTKVYTFVPVGTATADGEISIGADLAGAKLAIVAAINGTDSINTAHTLVSAAAFAVNDCVITALTAGVAGDLIATTETFDAVGNIFDAATLGTTTAGVDCVQADAVTAIVAAITASDTVGVGAADGAGDTVVLTADVKGVAANDFATTETMAHGSFAAVKLSGGVNGTVGDQWSMLADSSYLYVAVAAQTISTTNWRRISLGTAY